MKKILLVVSSILLLGGCFIFEFYPADYIIINTTGNRILDVYKLRNISVSENHGTNGVNFKHPNTGSHITIQGDVKIIRNPTTNEWNKYKEYHYDELFMSNEIKE